MLTPEMRERAHKLRSDAQVMGCGPAACEYQVGEYWTFCEAVDEFLEELLAAPMAAASVNPLYQGDNEGGA